MNTRATLEIIAPSVEEAIEKGLTELGLSQEAVEIEVLDSGTRGLFGLGTRQARIRLLVTGSAGDAEPHTQNAELEDEADLDLPGEAPAAEISQPKEDSAEENLANEDQLLQVARDTVAELLDKMGVAADVSASYGEAEDDRDRVPVLVEIHGDDLSILIGKRAETLNALQYIAGLIVSKEMDRSVPLVVDVEGYRSRRVNQLRQLARRMADQVAKTGRRLALEPMPASERRIIHMELRTHPDVTTQSVGDDPYRKVTIVPKE
jgi:spoIIIJ-associated protein